MKDIIITATPKILNNELDEDDGDRWEIFVAELQKQLEEFEKFHLSYHFFEEIIIILLELLNDVIINYEKSSPFVSLFV